MQRQRSPQPIRQETAILFQEANNHGFSCSSWQRWSIMLVMAVLFASCGTNGSSVSAVTPLATYRPLMTAYNYSQAQIASGLFVNLKGFFCTAGPFLRNLTLTTNQFSYDVGASQTIQNYLQLLETQAEEAQDTHLVDWLPPQPPKELQWVSGSTTCMGTLAITNTRSTAVGIQGLGFQLTAPTLRNSINYRRVSLQKDCPGCGGGPQCIYSVSVTLQGGTTGAHFGSPLTSTDRTQCPVPMIISPQVSIGLLVMFHDAQKRDLIYTGIPVLQMVDEKPISLSTFTTRLTFTHTDAFPCYQFQGTAFVPCPI